MPLMVELPPTTFPIRRLATRSARCAWGTEGMSYSREDWSWVVRNGTVTLTVLAKSPYSTTRTVSMLNAFS